jgi:AsmA protein
MGASPEELVARLGGTAHLSVKTGALVGLDVPVMLGHVMTGIAEGWTAAGNGETPFSRLEAEFAVEDGSAETADLALDGPAIAMAGHGSVDLLRRRLDLKMRPRPGGADDEATAASLPVAVIVAGSWSAPRIYPDVEGILENPAQAFERLRRRIAANAAKLDLGPAAPGSEQGGAAVTR